MECSDYVKSWGFFYLNEKLSDIEVVAAHSLLLLCEVTGLTGAPWSFSRDLNSFSPVGMMLKRNQRPDCPRVFFFAHSFFIFELDSRRGRRTDVNKAGRHNLIAIGLSIHWICCGGVRQPLATQSVIFFLFYSIRLCGLSVWETK